MKSKPELLAQTATVLALIPAAGFVYALAYETALLASLHLSLGQLPISVSDLFAIGLRKMPNVIYAIFGIAVAELIYEKQDRGNAADIFLFVDSLIKKYWARVLILFSVLLGLGVIAAYVKMSWTPLLYTAALILGFLMAMFIHELFSSHLESKAKRYVVLWFSVLLAWSAAEGASLGLQMKAGNESPFGVARTSTNPDTPLQIAEFYEKGLLVTEDGVPRFILFDNVSAIELKN